jgi:nucleoside-diphosphate-sugar epimerase
MKTVLVTGAAGFIGAAVVDALCKRGDRVVATDISMTQAMKSLLDTHEGLTFQSVEITEWPQIATLVQTVKPDGIIHCAAVVGVTNSLASPIGTFRINVEGSLNVFECMRLFGVKRVVHLSSEETYGVFEADTIDETHPNRPLKPYGISKYAVEQLAKGYADQYGLECIHVRTCWVYGPGLPRPRVPKTLVDAAVQGYPLHLASGGDFKVDHVYIDDCVSGILGAFDHPKHEFDVYHVSSGEVTTLKDIVQLIRDYVPDADISIGSGNYSFIDGTVTVRKGALSPKRAEKAFGYKPRYFMRKGLQAYIDYERARLKMSDGESSGQGSPTR